MNAHRRPSASGPRRPPVHPIWTYGYVFSPPIARERVGGIETLLVGERSKARLDAHVWEGRLVNGHFITHLLVVSDRPDQDLEANVLLEVELNRLEAHFAITASVEVEG
jgi:hypothetical protein